MTPSGDLFVEVDEYVELPRSFELMLGPLSLPTTTSDLKRAIGQQLQSDGAIVAPGERQPRPFAPTIPLHGSPTDVDMTQTGIRLRRQIAALVNNRLACSQGLYFDFGVDPWMNMWLLVGAANVSYTEAGITFGEFTLDIGDAYEIGSRVTHRPGRQFALADRRQSTVPRDTLASVYSSDYPTLAATALGAIPTSATDIALRSGAPAGSTIRPAKDGDQPLILRPIDLDTVTFEAPTNLYLNSVKVLDRQGFITTPTTDQDYRWETVYGPTQALTAGEPPVMENGLCRMRWDTQGSVPGFAIDAWTGTAWEEHAKAYAFRGAANLDALVSCRLTEWTPERAVLKLVLAASGDGTARETLIVTLQRGWTAPRLELYPAAPLASVGLVFSTRPADTTINWTNDSSGTTVTQSAVPSAVGPAFTNVSNVGWMTRTGRSPSTLQFALQLTGPVMSARRSTKAYGTLAYETVFTVTATYLSVHLGIGVSSNGNSSRTGVIDHSETSLMDTQSIPILVAR
jgi:hypothetical protein